MGRLPRHNRTGEDSKLGAFSPLFIGDGSFTTRRAPPFALPPYLSVPSSLGMGRLPPCARPDLGGRRPFQSPLHWGWVVYLAGLSVSHLVVLPFILLFI